MQHALSDVTQTTSWRLEIANPNHPESVFMIGSNGVTVEFDRTTTIEYIKAAFGLVDPLDVVFFAEPAPLASAEYRRREYVASMPTVPISVLRAASEDLRTQAIPIIRAEPPA